MGEYQMYLTSVKLIQCPKILSFVNINSVNVGGPKQRSSVKNNREVATTSRSVR